MSLVVGYAVGRGREYTEAEVVEDTESARIWEELNAPNKYEAKYLKAAEALKEAIAAVGVAVDALIKAERAADGLPLADKVAFFARDFEDRQCDLKQMMEKAERSEEA